MPLSMTDLKSWPFWSRTSLFFNLFTQSYSGLPSYGSVYLVAETFCLDHTQMSYEMGTDWEDLFI